MHLWYTTIFLTYPEDGLSSSHENLEHEKISNKNTVCNLRLIFGEGVICADRQRGHENSENSRNSETEELRKLRKQARWKQANIKFTKRTLYKENAVWPNEWGKSNKHRLQELDNFPSTICWQNYREIDAMTFPGQHGSVYQAAFRQPGDSALASNHRCPWIPMGPHGYPWVPMVPMGSPWVPMGFHGKSKNVGNHGF